MPELKILLEKRYEEYLVLPDIDVKISAFKFISSGTFSIDNDGEILLPSKMTVESNLSPNGMLAKWNRSSSKTLKTLFELERETKSKPIFEEASDAFSLLVRERISFFNHHNTQIEKIVIGQRLGEFLELCQENIRLLFESKTNIPIKYSSDRRTASLGAAWKKFCS